MTAEFKRLWSTPRRVSGGGLLDYPTPQQRYLRLRSYERYRRRPDAYPPGEEVMRGELGQVDSFRFIQAKPLPDPPRIVIMDGAGYNDGLVRAILNTYRSAHVLYGMDFANGPDWSAVQHWQKPDPVRPALPLHDQERMGAAELKRARRRIKLRQLADKGAIGRVQPKEGKPWTN